MPSCATVTVTVTVRSLLLLEDRLHLAVGLHISLQWCMRFSVASSDSVSVSYRSCGSRQIKDGI